MAWTVAFALLGALMFSMVIAPVLASLLFRKGAKEWKNPVMRLADRRVTVRAPRWASSSVSSPLAWALPASVSAIYLTVGGVIGSEFLPHLDEGALWVRGTLLKAQGPAKASGSPTKPEYCFAPFLK